MATWRNKASAVISEVIRQNPGMEPKELRKLISAAYPFGERKYHPYKIWCDEVNRQLGPQPQAEMSVSEAQSLTFDLCNAYMFQNFDIGALVSGRLLRVAEELDKFNGLLNLDTVMISAATARFLRGLKNKLEKENAKTNSTEAN